jgi:hypothetical protein
LLLMAQPNPGRNRCRIGDRAAYRTLTRVVHLSASEPMCFRKTAGHFAGAGSGSTITAPSALRIAIPHRWHEQPLGSNSPAMLN